MCASFPFSFEGGIWDLNVFIPDHFLWFCQLFNVIERRHGIVIRGARLMGTCSNIGTVTGSERRVTESYVMLKIRWPLI